jgi:hypothetical protein
MGKILVLSWTSKHKVEALISQSVERAISELVNGYLVNSMNVDVESIRFCIEEQ